LVENEQTREILRKILWREYFEDLVYESTKIAQTECKQYSLIDNSLHEFDEARLNIIYEML